MPKAKRVLLLQFHIPPMENRAIFAPGLYVNEYNPSRERVLVVNVYSITRPRGTDYQIRRRLLRLARQPRRA